MEAEPAVDVADALQCVLLQVLTLAQLVKVGRRLAEASQSPSNDELVRLLDDCAGLYRKISKTLLRSMSAEENTLVDEALKSIISEIFEMKKAKNAQIGKSRSGKIEQQTFEVSPIDIQSPEHWISPPSEIYEDQMEGGTGSLAKNAHLEFLESKLPDCFEGFQVEISRSVSNEEEEHSGKPQGLHVRKEHFF